MMVDTLLEVRSAGHQLLAVCREVQCREKHPVDLDRLIGRLGARTQLIPERGQMHFTDRMRCPRCRRSGMNLWIEPSAPKSLRGKEPNFRVTDHGEAPFSRYDMIATADNLMVAKGAFYAAAHFYRGRRITLMQGALVIDDTRVKMPEPMPPERFYAMRDGERNLGIRIMAPQ